MIPESVDAVVIGGGPAGLSAAKWLARYRRSVGVFDASEQRNRWTDEVHGYLGSDPIAPKALLDRARRELSDYPGTAYVEQRVEAVGQASDGFRVEADDAVTARAIVLATGVVDVFPEIDGFFEHYGADVFHCPSCDGYEAKGRHVAVFGWSSEVASFACGLLNWAADVTVVTDGRRFEGDDEERSRLAEGGISVFEAEAGGFEGRRGDLRAIVLRDGRSLDCTMAFFAIDNRPRTELAEMLGCQLDGDRCIAVDGNGATTIDGVYAAGDITPGPHLVQVAAASGATAGIACASRLSSLADV